jgi:hypothetical protein
MTPNQQLIKTAHEKGYRIKDGKCFNPKGREVVGSIKHHPVPYRQFSLTTPKGTRSVTFHGLLAYQLYGDVYFNSETVARHMDGNSLNNTESNIVLGTMKDNILDIPSKRRISKNLQSAVTKNKLNDGMKDLIIQDYKNGMVAKQLYKKYDTCLNTIYLIIRKLK